MQVLSGDNYYEPGVCYVLGHGVVKLEAVNKGFNITWSANKVYDARINSVRDLAAERAQALDEIASQVEAQALIAQRLASSPYKKH